MAKINGEFELNGLQISDLFFNSALPHYNGVFKESNPEPKQIAKALYDDALEFSNTIGCQVSAETLVTDFMARL